MAIDKVDLSGGMNLEEMTLVVSPAAVSNRGASQTGEKKPRRELARKKNSHELQSAARENDNDSDDDNDNGNNRPPHRMDRLA